MSKRQLVFAIVGCITVIVVVGIFAGVSVERYRKEAEVNAQSEIEKTKIEEEMALKRTQERMKFIPWYKESNK